MNDNRRAPRLPMVLSVHREGTALGSTENLSEGGMFIPTRETFALGQQVRIELSFPGLLQPVEVSCMVAWCRSGGRPGIGVSIPESEQQRLPLLRELVRAALDDAAPLPAPVGDFRVLVVDDSVNSAELYRHAVRRLAKDAFSLGQSSFETELVSQGSEALDRLREKPFQLVITDLAMPVLGGHGLIARIRADAALSATRILVVSGADDEALERALKLGADGVVRKPCRIPDLIYTVRALLRLGPRLGEK